jgi:uncharacterized OB-fold protein
MTDSKGATPKYVPDLDGLAVPFYEKLAAGTLAFQRCTQCGAYRHPPRHRCAGCGAAAFEWAPSSGRGRILTWTVTHRPVDPGWAAEVPYATVVVEMEEGVRVVGALRGVAPDTLAFELPVVANVEPATEAFALIRFEVE